MRKQYNKIAEFLKTKSLLKEIFQESNVTMNAKVNTIVNYTHMYIHTHTNAYTRTHTVYYIYTPFIIKHSTQCLGVLL